jgi:hypothetical protein
MNYINYLNHIIFTPSLYHRRYDLDMEIELEAASQLETAKRIALISLPFLSLYRPIGSALSLGMGTCRVVSHLRLCLHFEETKEWCHLSKEVAETTLAIFALASTFFAYSLGLVAINAIDTGKGLMHTAQFCWQREFSKAGEETLQALTSGFYLGFMITGSLELILTSTLIQGLTCLYQARGEFAKNRKLEGFAKLAMAAIRFRQTHQFHQFIQRRNHLFAMQKYQALAARALKGKMARHLVHHTLADLDGKIDEKKVLLSNQEEEYDFGAHFHGLGKGLVKGANISFRKIVVDGNEMIECQFKINHVHRKQMQETLKTLTKLQDKETKEILQFTGSHAQSIHLEKPSQNVSSWFFEEDFSQSKYTIHIEGLGSVAIGAEDALPNLYDKITIHMARDKTLYDLHELMALTQLDEALCLSSADDIERLKIGHLFRIFFPREATPFERTEEFFSLSTKELKTAIIQKAPEMEKFLADHLDRMSPTEILPGKVRYQVDGLADEIYKLGGRALTAAITGHYLNDEVLYEKVASMLRMGLICQEQKDSYQLDSSGLGGSYFTGGADAVYTQMVTDQLIKTDPTLDSLQYQSHVRLLISLEALNAGTYQYFYDDYGTRIYSPSSENYFWDDEKYAERPSIFELTKKLQETPSSPNPWGASWIYSGHEIMLKERIAPSLFQGLMVDAEETRIELLNYLKKRQLIELNKNGQETILGKPADEFIRVGKMATQALTKVA